MSPLLLGGQLLGIGAGRLAWTELRPSAGDVALASSVGLWSGVVAALLIAEADTYGPTMGTLLFCSDVGLIAGGLIASSAPMSRGRTLLLDADGLLGMPLRFQRAATDASCLRAPSSPFFAVRNAPRAKGARGDSARLSLLPSPRRPRVSRAPRRSAGSPR